MSRPAGKRAIITGELGGIGPKMAILPKRYAQESDVVNLVLFLVSDEASYLTGGQFTVDGGQAAM